MRILMLGDGRTEHLARWARHFKLRGDNVLVATADGGQADLHLPMPVRWPALAYPLLVPALRRLCANFRPDLVVAHYLPNYGLMTVMANVRPHVVVGWGSDLLVLPKRSALQRARLRYVATRAQAFLVDAQMLVEPLVRLGAPVESVFVCPFGVDDDVLQLEGSLRRPAGQVPTVLCNRRLDARYRIDVLLEALAGLPCEFRACIANEGSDRLRYQQEAVRLGLHERVEFPGFLERRQYLASLDQSDIYVSTSPTDSTSVSLLEAMAAGLACVVPDLPGNREWITDGQNGVLYPPLSAAALASQLHALCSDSERVRRLGKAARATVRARGQWSQTIRRAELLFAQLVADLPCHAS